MTLRSVVRLFGALLSIACLAYFGISAAKAFSTAGTHLEVRAIVAAVAMALPSYAAGYAAFALVWHILLEGMDARARRTESFGTFLVSQFGKYLPGNIAHHAGRILLSRKSGHSLATVGMAMVLETLVVVTAAAVLSIPLAATSGVLLRQHADPSILIAIAVSGTIVACVAAWFFMRHRALRQLRDRFLSVIDSFQPARRVPLLSKAFVLALVGIALCAGSLGILGAADLADLTDSYVDVVALFSAAWIAGLLTPGAPAGLGVREVILMEGLSTHYGEANATTAAILFRLLTVLADLIALGIGTLLLRRARDRSGAVTRS